MPLPSWLGAQGGEGDEALNSEVHKRTGGRAPRARVPSAHEVRQSLREQMQVRKQAAAAEREREHFEAGERLRHEQAAAALEREREAETREAKRASLRMGLDRQLQSSRARKSRGEPAPRAGVAAPGRGLMDSIFRSADTVQQKHREAQERQTRAIEEQLTAQDRRLHAERRARHAREREELGTLEVQARRRDEERARLRRRMTGEPVTQRATAEEVSERAAEREKKMRLRAEYTMQLQGQMEERRELAARRRADDVAVERQRVESAAAEEEAERRKRHDARALAMVHARELEDQIAKRSGGERPRGDYSARAPPARGGPPAGERSTRPW